MGVMAQAPVAVVAFGGNALVEAEEPGFQLGQIDRAEEVAQALLPYVEEGYRLLLVHGNGPQVGFILRRSELASNELHEVPLDYCGADTQGAIGYMLQQNLINDFRARGIDKNVATVVTQVEVDPNDSAFDNPSKPIGSFMDEEQARQRTEDDGWQVKEDSGRGWRRVVASPKPKRIVEIEIIRQLLDAGNVVIGVGGGGIPVVADDNGDLRGVAAVIDKDLASALLANEVDADLLLISTAVEKCALYFGTPDEEWIDEFTVDEVKRYLDEGIHFAEGSMAPKMRAVVQYLEGGGKEALITNPENIERAVAGETGTRIVP